MSLKFKYPTLLFIFLCFSACIQSPLSGDESNGLKYSIYILGKDGKDYLLQTNRLDSGMRSPEQDGTDVNAGNVSRAIIVKNGFYYHLNRKKGTFIKYKLVNKVLIEIASVPLPDFSIENFCWKSQDTLLLTGLNAANFSQVKYTFIDTRKMQQIVAANMDIPRPEGRFEYLSVGFVMLRAEKIFVGYTYHQQLSASDYTTSDTTYITEMSYPQMKTVKTSKDIRSTYPGGVNTIQPYSFNDEQHNYYFMTCPGIALGNRPELPTGIMRINATEDKPDKNYFFNLSNSVIHNHAYGIWYLGNNKAIVRSERKDLFKGLGDHYSTAHFEFYVVDLLNLNAKKLSLPLDKGTRRECVIVDKEVAYISVNSDTEGNFIWLYHIKTGELKKGLQLTGNTDFILRIDQLNP